VVFDQDVRVVSCLVCQRQVFLIVFFNKFHTKEISYKRNASGIRIFRKIIHLEISRKVVIYLEWGKSKLSMNTPIVMKNFHTI
jgi:hypothetical protein